MSEYDLIPPDQVDMSTFFNKECATLFDRMYKFVAKAVSRDYYAKYAAISSRKKTLDEQEKRIKQQQDDLRRGLLKPMPASKQLQIAFTVEFFNTLVDQIGWWHTKLGADSEWLNMSRAFLYPAVYQQILNEDEAYYLTKLPTNIEDVVLLGRAQVTGHFSEEAAKARKEAVAHHPENEKLQAMDELRMEQIKRWWIDIALPLIYDGARDPAWEITQAWDVSEVVLYQTNEEYRTRHHGSLAALSSYTESCKEILMDFSGIPEWRMQCMASRFTEMPGEVQG